MQIMRRKQPYSYYHLHLSAKQTHKQCIPKATKPLNMGCRSNKKRMSKAKKEQMKQRMSELGRKSAISRAKIHKFKSQQGSEVSEEEVVAINQ